MSADRRTYLSLCTGEKFKDTYTEEERKDILASLFVAPAVEDLERLESRKLTPKIRELALRDGGDAIRDFRRFNVALFQALLHSQHEIILLEEKMSHRISTDDVRRLTLHLTDYSLSPYLHSSQCPGQSC